MKSTVKVLTGHTKEEVEAAVAGCYAVKPCEGGFRVTVEETDDAIDEVTENLNDAGLEANVEEDDEAEENEEVVLLREHYDEMRTAFDKFDRLLKQLDRHEWERWKAGGKAVSDEFVSMYPHAGECLESLES